SWDDGGPDMKWSTVANWSTNGSPNGTDVLVGDLPTAIGDTTLIDSPYSIRSLTLANGADADTTQFTLSVNGQVHVSDPNSVLLVSEHANGINTSSAIAKDLRITNA